jgi:Spy/CpxP family protein refolding chaperone
MRRYLPFAIIFFLFFCPPAVFGQGPGKGHGRGQAFERRGCSPLEALDLSEAQRASVQEIEGRYWDGIVGSREKMMIRHLELQGLIRDPNTSVEAIREKSRELGDLQSEIREKMMDYQIEIRSVLTPDQMRRWCTLVGEPSFKKGWRGGL